MAGQYWKNAATLMVVARHTVQGNAKRDFKVLMAKRSSKSKFMPNAYVFPGGVSEQSDFALQWKEILEPCGSLEKLTAPFQNSSIHKLTKKMGNSFEHMKNYVSVKHKNKFDRIFYLLKQ